VSLQALGAAFEDCDSFDYFPLKKSDIENNHTPFRHSVLNRNLLRETF